MRRALFPLLFFVFWALPAAGQNLVPDGDFDVDLGAWTIGSPTGPTGLGMGTIDGTHDPGADAQGCSDSGALRLEWDVMHPGMASQTITLAESGCVDTPSAGESQRYGWAAQGLQDGTGDAIIFFCFYPDPSCGGVPGCALELLPTSTESIYSFHFRSAAAATQASFRVWVTGNTAPEGADSATRGTVLLDKVFTRTESEIEPLTSLPSLLTTNGLTASFAGAGTGGGPLYGYTYRWEFGDGAVSSEQNPFHTYAAPGVYLALLQVSDGFQVQTQPLKVIVAAAEIPTLAGSGLIALVALLALAGAVFLRQRLV